PRPGPAGPPPPDPTPRPQGTEPANCAAGGLQGGGAPRNYGTMGRPGVGPGGEGAVAEDRQPGRREPPGHGSANRGRRGVLAASIAVGLLALVAVGSLRGPLGSGGGGASEPA